MAKSGELYFTRRSLVGAGSGGLAVAGLGAAGLGLTRALAQDSEIEGNARGDMPTNGALRPGPVGLNPPTVRRKGVTPVAMKIEKAAVDSQIETTAIEDGVMLDPSGPYVIAWYEDTGKLGQDTNLVFAGHLDYYDVGEAVFFHLGELAENDPIEVIGEDEESYLFRVEWARNYNIDELDATTIQEIVGKTKTEYLTLITCGGPFDANVGQYLDRFVVRAIRSL